MSLSVHRITSILTVIIPAAVIILSSGCSKPTGDGFAIYLTRDDIEPTRATALKDVSLEDRPLISLLDIITYNAQTHELKLTPAAFERIARLPVPVRGKTFVVCVDRKPVYTGAFWTPISSISFSGVTIWQPLGAAGPPVVTLELGYPGPAFYGGEDPRNNPEIIRSLRASGKLVTSLSIANIEQLPRSMKGYELYSWREDSGWQFSLITGTNRDKTTAEITSDEDFISEVGWVKIRVTGAEALEPVLAKLPPGEDVLWLARPRLDQAPPGEIVFELPEPAAVNMIKAGAARVGLVLTVI